MPKLISINIDNLSGKIYKKFTLCGFSYFAMEKTTDVRVPEVEWDFFKTDLLV